MNHTFSLRYFISLIELSPSPHIDQFPFLLFLFFFSLMPLSSLHMQTSLERPELFELIVVFCKKNVLAIFWVEPPPRIFVYFLHNSFSTRQHFSWIKASVFGSLFSLSWKSGVLSQVNCFVPFNWSKESLKLLRDGFFARCELC